MVGVRCPLEVDPAQGMSGDTWCRAPVSCLLLTFLCCFFCFSLSLSLSVCLSVGCFPMFILNSSNSCIQSWFTSPCAILASHGIYTSSTPQGGGRSFKNRNPIIGEVGCCESRMAERIHWWTARWLELWFLEWLQWLQWSPCSQLLDVVWCSAVLVVVV